MWLLTLAPRPQNYQLSDFFQIFRLSGSVNQEIYKVSDCMAELPDSGTSIGILKLHRNPTLKIWPALRRSTSNCENIKDHDLVDTAISALRTTGPCMAYRNLNLQKYCNISARTFLFRSNWRKYGVCESSLVCCFVCCVLQRNSRRNSTLRCRCQTLIVKD